MALDSRLVPPSCFRAPRLRYPQDPPELLLPNSVIVEIFPARGLALYEFGKRCAALDRKFGDRRDSFDLLTRLAAPQEEAVSIRFRGGRCLSDNLPNHSDRHQKSRGRLFFSSALTPISACSDLSVLGEMFEELEPFTKCAARSGPPTTVGQNLRSVR